MQTPEERSSKKEFEEVVVQVSRVAKVVKGGKKLGFRSLVVIGNHKGKVGIGLGKAAEVSESVRKSIDHAKKNIIQISIINDTIPHRVNFKYKAVRLFLSPAAPGTGVIAGGAVRAVLELSGIKNVLSKLSKSTNAINCVYATYEALRSMKTAQSISQLRDKNIVHPGEKAHIETEKIRKQKEEEAKVATEEAHKKKQTEKKTAPGPIKKDLKAKPGKKPKDTPKEEKKELTKEEKKEPAKEK